MCKKVCFYDVIVEDMRFCKCLCLIGVLNFNFKDLSVEIIEDKCVNCGVCMVVCLFGVIEDKSLLVKVVNNLVSKEKIYVVVVLVIIGEFGLKIIYG